MSQLGLEYFIAVLLYFYRKLDLGSGNAMRSTSAALFVS
jgi:hypothetical protein